jgi:hypothetical protein
VVSPAVLKISYVTWFCVFSSQILFWFTNPSPLGLVIIIMSPLSWTYKCHLAAYLYTSCLLVYSFFDSDMLHFITPLCFLMPSYSCRLADFDGHSMTSRDSPGGAFTLMQPVVSAKSCPRWAERAYFHCSLSPL